jgi:murein DD-endopeptidase MepM/ murein hydrolase activator NlpD
MADVHAIARLSQSGEGAGPKTAEQVRGLAAQFEALVLGQMLRELRESMFGDEEGKESGFGGGPLGDAMFAELGTALSRAGGIGLSDSLVAPLLAEADPAAARTATALPSTLPASGPVATTAATVPLPGRLSSAYGWRRDPLSGDQTFHKGIDVAIPFGADVPVARDGSVAFVGERSGFGLTVVVDHEKGISTRYAHLSAADVRVGDRVAAGQTIAKAGASGRATAPHLHFEVLRNGQAVDPGF